MQNKKTYTHRVQNSQTQTFTSTHTHGQTDIHTQTQYKKTTLLKRKEQRRSYKLENLERGKGESHTAKQHRSQTLYLHSQRVTETERLKDRDP